MPRQRRVGGQAAIRRKAVFAVAHTMIVVVSLILSSDGATYQGLGPDYFEHRNDAVPAGATSYANSNDSETS